METQRAKLVTWLRQQRGRPDPQGEADLLAMADAYDQTEATDELSAEGLAVIVSGVSDSRSVLWMTATDFLGSLSERFPQAAEAVGTVFSSRKAEIRFAAICSLRANTPASVTDRLLRAGLLDVSYRVRWKAAEKISTLQMRHLVPELTTALAAEKNAKARNDMALQLCLLRDGYQREPAKPRGFSITVRIKHGIRSAYVSEDQVRANGIDRIASALREMDGPDFFAAIEAATPKKPKA